MTNSMHDKKIMVAMSGGVDSAVAALLCRDMVNDTNNVCGATAKMFDSSSKGATTDNGEFWCEGISDAKKVCDTLGIEHKTYDCTNVFQSDVMDKFAISYILGNTPNPCVDCNRCVKFDSLQAKREEDGYDYLATGHYARVAYDDESGRWQLMRAKNTDKDQSYFLYGLTQEQLSHTLFPLGDMTKGEVRAIASENGFTNAEKSESQDVCFIPDGDYVGFVRRWCGDGEDAKLVYDNAFDEGDIIDADGNVLGRHTGLINYTIGQRKGIGVASDSPLYVIDKDNVSNELIVGHRDELETDVVFANKVNLVSVDESFFPVSRKVPVLAKVRYRQKPAKGLAAYDADKGVLIVTFPKKITMPASGQALVLYDCETGEKVLAGGTIVL